ncbi:FKBP-type peptidyl-prolyl cis-trans isomerase [Corynebacterium atypicum]|uniref:FKBP-type peptidyl-prolyl cis-trans isomerase n=1 Tax=Corynebacterium atypicum TaxID=191610 RepID=UPI00068C70CC|nr:FKBP-type peptidyl-prolyl cis-trans isomerase [Corynebacterium atypicum]
MDKPHITVPDGPAPANLVIDDLTSGEGPEAAAGDTVEVHYVGVDFETGDEFDSSWDRNQTITFPLDRLIAGWQEGIPGMKVGGRRLLVCPPEKAYGPAGGGHPLSGRTLVFVIDLLGIEGEPEPEAEEDGEAEDGSEGF